MSNQAIAQGTLKADGTLVVNQKLHLTPGPVLVTVQAMTPRQRGLADVIDEIRQGQQARASRGAAPRRSRSVVRKEKRTMSRGCKPSAGNRSPARLPG